MPEREISNKSLKSVSGHKKDDEIELRTGAADLQCLAREAIGKLSERETRPLKEREDALAQAAIAALATWRNR